MGWFNHQLETYFCVSILRRWLFRVMLWGGALQGIAQNLAKQVVLHPFDTARKAQGRVERWDDVNFPPKEHGWMMLRGLAYNLLGVGLFSLLNRHGWFEVEDRLAILAPPIRLGQGYSSEMLFYKSSSTRKCWRCWGGSNEAASIFTPPMQPRKYHPNSRSLSS